MSLKEQDKKLPSKHIEKLLQHWQSHIT